MENEVLKELLIEDIEDYCNMRFDRDNLPAGVVLAIHRKLYQDYETYGVAQESIADMTKTYADPSILEKDWRASIQKYARPHLVGDKRMRKYRRG